MSTAWEPAVPPVIAMLAVCLSGMRSSGVEAASRPEPPLTSSAGHGQPPVRVQNRFVPFTFTSVRPSLTRTRLSAFVSISTTSALVSSR